MKPSSIELKTLKFSNLNFFSYNDRTDKTSVLTDFTLKFLKKYFKF